MNRKYYWFPGSDKMHYNKEKLVPLYGNHFTAGKYVGPIKVLR